MGGTSAAHLGVALRFASPDTPDDQAPRWNPNQEGLGSCGRPDEDGGSALIAVAGGPFGQEGEFAAELIVAARLATRIPVPAGSPGPVDEGSEGGPTSLDILGREDATLTTYPGADGSRPRPFLYNAADTRRTMSTFSPALTAFTTDVKMPTVALQHEPDMQVVEL